MEVNPDRLVHALEVRSGQLGAWSDRRAMGTRAVPPIGSCHEGSQSLEDCRGED